MYQREGALERGTGTIFSSFVTGKMGGIGPGSSWAGLGRATGHERRSLMSPLPLAGEAAALGRRVGAAPGSTAVFFARMPPPQPSPARGGGSPPPAIQTTYGIGSSVRRRPGHDEWLV